MRRGLACVMGGLCCAGLSGVMAAEPVYVEGAATRALRFYTAAGREAVQQPKRAAIFRVMPAATPQQAANGPFAAANAVAVGGPTDLTLQQIAALSAIFASAEGYTEGHRCPFEPAVAVRFVGPWATVDVVLCFACNDVKVVQGAQVVDVAGFTMHRTALLEIIKNIYPRDPLMQELR